VKLSVPEKSITIEAGVELRPTQVRRWLESLPVLDVVENLNKILAALHAVNRNPVKPEVRFRLLEEYRDPVRFISSEMGVRLKIFSLPLSEKNKQLTGTARALEQEMLIGYKNVLLEMRSRVAPGRVDEIYVTAIHRALSHGSRLLMRYLEYYVPVQPGLWQEIHQLYSLAAALEVTGRAVQGTAADSGNRTTISQAYKHALLLGLCSPYHLPFHMINKVDAFLDWWADSAKLVAHPGTSKKKCQFTVMPDGDMPGKPFSPEDNGDESYILDTRPLVEEVHLQMTAMNTGVIPNRGLSREFYDDTARNMLRRLVVFWGLNPTRRFSRNSAAGPVELALGTEAVNWYLNGEQDFQLCHESAVTEIHMQAVGGFTDTVTRAQGQASLQSWQVDNECACGFGLHTDGGNGYNLRVNDLVTLRAAGSGKDWNVGMIRWMRNTPEGRIEIGVQKLAPSAQPVAVQAVSAEGGKQDDYRLGVMLAEVPALNQPRTLVTPKGVYQPQRNLFLDTGTTLQMVRSGGALEESSTCDWFEFTVLDI